MKNNIPTITVDPELRELILPSEKLVLGINGDVEVNAVQFQLPLTYRELELKRLTPRINYVNANGDTNYYESTMESDESNCYFIWPITPDITAYTGHVRFSLTLYQSEGDNILHKFNTRSAVGRVYTGFEAEKQVTPEQQQTLLSKLETEIKADLTDHTEKLKNELTEKGKEILDGFGESGNVSEELKNIKQDLSQKLTAPPTPEVDKILKIKSVNEDGTFVCEWADGGSNLDVQINGESIVQDGVAEIPVAKRDNVLGVIKTIPYEFWGTGVGADYSTGQLRLYPASEKNIDARQKSNVSPISVKNLDYAVKAAMCDGKGAAWTADEQKAAKERIGVIKRYDVDLFESVILEEEAASIRFNFPETQKLEYCILRFEIPQVTKSSPLYIELDDALAVLIPSGLVSTSGTRCLTVECFIKDKEVYADISGNSTNFTTGQMSRAYQDNSQIRTEINYINLHMANGCVYPAGTKVSLLI